ncbi:MAG: hypothetical protein AB1779_08720 [Candidatus Thermoplasmatota archaeon]
MKVRDLPISSFQRPLAEWNQQSIDKVEPRPGVYEFYDKYELIIFIDGSTNLRETLQKHYNTGFAQKPCLKQATHFRWEYIDKYENALKNHLIVFKQTSGGELPECNK